MSGIVIPKDGSDLKLVREFLGQQRDQYNSYADLLEEPWKSHFLDAKSRLNDFLAKLPPIDQVNGALDAANALGQLFSLLAGASALNGMMAAKIRDGVTGLQAAVDAAIKAKIESGELFAATELPKRVADAVQAKLTAGDVVEKAMSTQLCADAKRIGIVEGEKKVRDEIAASAATDELVTKRKAVLQTASLALPEDTLLKTILGGTEDEFNAARAKYQTRAEDLRTAGIQLAADSELLPKLWLGDAEFKIVEGILKSTPAFRTAGNPFAAGGQTSAPPVMLV